MELTVAPINKLCSLFGGKNLPRVNLSPSKRMTLDFSATFSNATLNGIGEICKSDIQLSKEAINAFSSFPQGMTLSDYIHFKQDRLLFAFGKKEWLEGEEKRLHECVTQLKKCKEAKEKTKENIENIISLTKKQTEKLKEKKKKLLADSQSEQKNSSDFLRGQRKAYKRANKDFLSLEQERGRLVELFRKQSALLNVAVSQNNCEANEVDVRKNAAEIEKGQQNVANDKQAVTASIKSTLERFDASLFAQWYGKCFIICKKS